MDRQRQDFAAITKDLTWVQGHTGNQMKGDLGLPNQVHCGCCEERGSEEGKHREGDFYSPAGEAMRWRGMDQSGDLKR